MTSDLIALHDIIVSSIYKIVDVCAATGKDFPSLDKPIHPSEFTPDDIRNHPDVADAIGPTVAAAFQLIQTVQSPPHTLASSAFQMTLGIVERANAAEILSPAGPKGLHVNEIAAKSNTDPKKLARILRYLATVHWFKEIAPDVFANNMLSSLLDRGKEVTLDLAMTKHSNTSGLAAIVGYNADEVIKTQAVFGEHFFDPQTAFSEEPNETALQRALNTTLSTFAYYETPEGQYRGRRFTASMIGASKLHPPAAVLTGFDWDSLPKDALVVDVGGNVCYVGLEIAKAFPHLYLVIEDRPAVVGNAKEYWNANLPSHIQAGKVHFIGCDFFEPQPALPTSPAVFVLRMVHHDWSDKYAVKLLRNLRNAAGPNTRLLVLDNILGYACETPDNPGPEIEDNVGLPKPLLPNMGGANLLPYQVDLLVMSTLNSAARTVGGFTSIFDASGWKLQEIRKNRGNKHWWPSIIGVPV